MRQQAITLVIGLAVLLGLTGASFGDEASSAEARVHYKAALLALKDNDVQTARTHLVRAAGLDPSNPLVQYNLALVCEKLGAVSDGLDSLRRARNLGLPEDVASAAEDLEARLVYQQGRLSNRLGPFVGRWSVSSVDYGWLGVNGAGDSCGDRHISRTLDLQSADGLLRGSYATHARIISTGSCTHYGEVVSDDREYWMSANAEAKPDGDAMRLRLYQWTCRGQCSDEDRNSPEAFYTIQSISSTAIERISYDDRGRREVIQFIKK